MVIILDAEMIIVLAILTFVAAIMIVIGLCQVFKTDAPVGFYNVADPPKKDEISDVILWNKKHGRMWIAYGLCIELGFWVGYILPTDEIKMIFMMGGVLLPLPFMVLGHHKLEKKYKVK